LDRQFYRGVEQSGSSSGS